jgi:AcrR family transcriptional regulator
VGKKPKGAYHHGNLREAIVIAATGIVNTVGALALTVRTVADRVGVSHAAVYHHFEDRTQMIAAVAEAGFVAVGADMARAAEGTPQPLARYRRMGVAYITFALRHPKLYGVMFGAETAAEHANPALAAAARAVFDKMRAVIAECQAAGSLAPGSPELHTLFCWSAVHGYASLVSERQLGHLPLAGSPSTLAETIVDRIFTGVGRR